MFRRRPRPVAGWTSVITGAGSGMGRALAQRLSAPDTPVALLDWDEPGLRETAASLNGPVLVEKVDVRDTAAMFAFADRVAAWAPRPVGSVFNNAGVVVSAIFVEATASDQEWVLDVNLNGVVHGTRAFLPLLQEQDAGVVVNMSSMYGLAGIPLHTGYCASKFAVRGFTEALRHELAGSGVRAVTVHPGMIRTGLVDRGRSHDPEGRSHEQLVAEFHAAGTMTAERAAELIHRGVDAGKQRILVGPDAYVFDVATRLTPTHYLAVLSRLEPVLARIASSR